MKFKESFLQPHHSGFGMWQIAEDNGDDWYGVDELIEAISENCTLVEWEDWGGIDPRGSIYNETDIYWMRPTEEGDFVCILNYPCPDSVRWYELVVYDSDGSRCGSLGDYMDNAAEEKDTYAIKSMTLLVDNHIARIQSWFDYFIAAENEEPSAKSPEVTTDWTGFLETYLKVTND